MLLTLLVWLATPSLHPSSQPAKATLSYGRRAGSGSPAANDEQEQTLNRPLSETGGFDLAEGTMSGVSIPSRRSSGMPGARRSGRRAAGRTRSGRRPRLSGGDTGC